MATMTIEIRDVEYQVPTSKEVCPTCHGEGKHSRAMGAISAREFAESWEPEEIEAYFNGAYDKVCEQCRGIRVIDVADYESLGHELSRQYEQEQRELADEAMYDAAVYRAEMGYGCD